MELIERALDHLTMNVSANEAFRRPNGSMARVLTLIILLALPSLVDAHGRNSTSIRADVQEGGVRVVINAVVIDLLQLTGTSTADWEGLPLNEREGILRQGAGMMVARFRLVADMTDYVERLREHMSWEEGDLFRRADALVAAESAMFVSISHLDKLDPVFGPEREHSFANLLQSIKDLAEP